MSIIEEVYDRFCTERFPLPTDAQVSALEQRIGTRFPDDFRRYVLEFNGGRFDNPDIERVGDECPHETLETLHGIGAPHWASELGRDNLLALFDENDPPKIVPVGHTGNGGLIILVTDVGTRGEILLKEAYGDFHYLADGIEGFFSLLREPTR